MGTHIRYPVYWVSAGARIMSGLHIRLRGGLNYRRVFSNILKAFCPARFNEVCYKVGKDSVKRVARPEAHHRKKIGIASPGNNR